MHSINLIPSRDDAFLMQFLNWALTIGRLLVILVETLALGTFLYRFTLDWQIVDLKDKVKNQRVIVSSFKTQEENFRNMQTRLGLIKKIDNAAEGVPELLANFLEMGKGYVTFNSIFVSDEAVRSEVRASTVANINAFVEMVKNNGQVKSVSIDKVENKTSTSEIIVAISAYLKSEVELKKTEAQQSNGEKVFIDQ